MTENPMKQLKCYFNKLVRKLRSGCAPERMSDTESRKPGRLESAARAAKGSSKSGRYLNRHIFRVVFTSFLLPLMHYASYAQPAKDLLRGPLGFSMQEADKLLEGRSWAVTSPHLDNTESFHFGFGKAKTGLMWGDCSVSFETSTAFTLSVTHNSKMDERTTRLKVSGLRWDEEEQLYKGQATYYGKTHRECEVKILPMRNVKVRIWRTHPFQGSLYSISGDLTDVYQNEDCEFIRSEESSGGYVRTFTTVETIRAMEQVRRLWFAKVEPIHSELTRRRRLTTQLPDCAYKDDLRKDITVLETEIRKKTDVISEVEYALKFGGKVRHFDGTEQRYEHRAGVSEVDSALLNLTGQLMGEALSLPELAKSLKEQNDGLEAVLNTGGVGISMETTPAGVCVAQTVAGSPAEASGIRRGDSITAINGNSTAGMTVEEAAALIRGLEDSTVQLSIVTDSNREAKTVKLTRKRLRQTN